MKKMTIYLDEDAEKCLQRLITAEGRSQSGIVRAALAAYLVHRESRRSFALTASGKGDGTSVADIPEEELLKGFGEPELL